jgi:predicted nucleic acid-binding protein
LFAALDRRDAAHKRSRQLFKDTEERLIIPAPVLVETDYWVRKWLGTAAFLSLLDNVAAGAFEVIDLVPDDYERVRSLCARYADSDIGFVDAAVLAVVERLGEDKLATLDHRHFGMMRPRHVEALRLLPE